MIKRNLSLLLVFCLLLGCVACGTNKPVNNAGEETMKVDEALDSNEIFKKKVDGDVAIDADGAKGKIDADDAAIDADEMSKKVIKHRGNKKKIDDGSIME